MGRHALRLTAVFLATGALGSTVGSASPPRLAVADVFHMPLAAPPFHPTSPILDRSAFT